MARIKIDLPGELDFKTHIPVTIQNVNYGGHVGNDAILSLLHEARLRYLSSLGYSELNKETGSGLIMADVAIVYKGEGFHGDVFEIAIGAADFSSFGFDLYYRITTNRGGDTIVIAEAKTGMICFDYRQRKVSRLPEEWKQAMS